MAPCAQNKKEEKLYRPKCPGHHRKTYQMDVGLFGKVLSGLAGLLLRLRGIRDILVWMRRSHKAPSP